MKPSAIVPPVTDPTPIFELYRGSLATELLTAAVAHFNVFGRLAAGPKSAEALREELELAERPAVVLLTALRAMGLLAEDGEGQLDLTPLAREHLVPGDPFDVGGYVGLSADSPGVVELVERLRTDRPAGVDDPDKGAAYIYREGIESAMEHTAAARHLTLALAGRARNVAPVLAARYPLDDACLLLDIGGGSGIYTIAWLQQHPTLRAIIWDGPEVLKVTAEMAAEFGVADRLECVPADMFRDAPPAGVDVVLLSNILHDWDVPECRALVAGCARRAAAGRPAPGPRRLPERRVRRPAPRCPLLRRGFPPDPGPRYSVGDYRRWMAEAGLIPGNVIPTLIHCGVLPGTRPA